MKKTLIFALISALVAAPAFAADTPAKTSPAKAAAKQQQNKAPAFQDGCAMHGIPGHYGYGMMGGGYGAGMMGGYGGGMMGGYGTMMEPDMHLLGALNLNTDQQAIVNKVSDDLRHNNWVTQGQLNDETAKLRDLYEADKRDPTAIGNEYQKVFDLKRQMIEAYLNAQNRIEAALTPEQLAKLKEARRNMHGMYGHPAP